MRVSGSGCTNVCEKPVAAPVVRRRRSLVSREGSTAASTLVGVLAGKKGWVGEKFRLGWGRTLYGDFWSEFRLMKYSVWNGATAWNCCALAKFGPGVPS